MKKKIVVVCPGRGSYTKENLNYLSKFPQFSNKLEKFNSFRSNLDQPTLSELDSAKTFKTNVHTKGEHASLLIFACSYLDFLNIDKDKYEIVAVTGNSMGWYSALALAGALDLTSGMDLINTMGSMMKDKLIGGQVIYPVVNEDWSSNPSKLNDIEALLEEINSQDDCEVYDSIFLGGYRVFGGTEKGLSELLKRLPKAGDFPFKLINNGAFHTPLCQSISDKANIQLSDLEFHKPTIPLIDGQGRVWSNYSANSEDLKTYTLNHQVTETYDFTKSISIALKEFAPDHLLLLGPGNSLGSSIGQILSFNKWKGIKNKQDFTKDSSYLLLSDPR